LLPELILIRGLQERLFGLIHENRLIYNTCWEDPRLDRDLLGLSPESTVVAITSAGCNVLDYLLDGPAAIHAVDVNFRQNAVLSLKMALFEAGDFRTLFSLFGEGGDLGYRDIYASLRAFLPVWAQTFWDNKIGYFNPKGLRRSFYWRGASGDFAWAFNSMMLQGKKKNLALALLEANSLEEQQRCYERIEPELFSRGISWLLRQPGTMAFIGVPSAQLRLIEGQYPGGLGCFVQDKLRQVFTHVPIQDNYFWQVYLTGSYTTDCCPSYLEPKNFPTLRHRLDRINIHTATVTEFLQAHPGVYSHFVLLDHQDWLAWNDIQALLAEWRQIFQNSRPGTRILLRSAGSDLSFLPKIVTAKLRFFPELTQPLHPMDRVGTYGSLHLAEVC
jgi:S-adenosylmethionine-diacylglycerol 3-amino-3-carboxypropyl transferase